LLAKNFAREPNYLLRGLIDTYIPAHHKTHTHVPLAPGRFMQRRKRPFWITPV
jgi:hypothetical protein